MVSHCSPPTTIFGLSGGRAQDWRSSSFEPAEMIRAVFWDFGGVITTSPFESFARYERDNGLPPGFIRSLNAANHHENAWAKLERSEVGFDDFCALYEAEAAAAGHTLDARAVLACLSGDVRPAMVRALRLIKASGLKQACLTNNFVGATVDDAKADRKSTRLNSSHIP